MAKVTRLYWDSCAWIGFLNGEPDKKRELEIVYTHARQGHYELWTSTLSIVETRRLKAEEQMPRPYPEDNAKKIEAIFRQPFVKSVPMALDIAEDARQIFRNTPNIKWQDAIHLASALRWNADALHTYDNADLLHLTLMMECRNKSKLVICYPDLTTDGELFAKRK